MMIKKDDGTFLCGPFDVACILRNINTGTFHPAFFEESPLPGPIPPVEETTLLRLKSTMHHTVGYPTIEEAVAGLEEMRLKIQVEDCNCCNVPIAWDGSIGIVWMYPNWKRTETGTFESVLTP